MSGSTRFQRKLERRYDALFRDPVFRDFVNDSGYANVGCWDATTHDGEQACDRLVDRLLAWVPQRSGRVLDVACGQGGTTRRLTRCFAPRCVTAINISKSQLDAAARRAPGCAFAVMDAAHLGFADASFDCILCVEAAGHFETRAAFLQQAHRVLRPGGVLVFTDIVARWGFGRIPRANRLRSVAEYEALLRSHGFEAIALEDATSDTWRAFARRYAAFARRAGVMRLRDLARAPYLVYRYAIRDLAVRSYVLGHARRPPARAHPESPTAGRDARA